MSSYVGDPPYGNPMWQSYPIYIPPSPSPRTLPVNVPFSTCGLTIVTMDTNGNLTIKVDQPEEDSTVPPANRNTEAR